jgi:hypothetical protein
MIMATVPLSARRLRAIGQFLDERALRLVSLTAVPAGFLVVALARDPQTGRSSPISFHVNHEQLEPIEQKLIRTRRGAPGQRPPHLA